MDLRPGTMVDKYLVEGLLGSGGMASVFRVVHSQLGVRYALKLLEVPSREFRERLLKEGRLQAALRHPNIVAVVDVVVHDNCPGLVLEYIEGPTLEQLMASEALSLEQIDALAVGIMQGVRAAHKHGLVHRDLKPANVLLAPVDDKLTPKIADFGLAKSFGAASGVSQTRAGQVLGTPAYMSPEQFRDSKDVDQRTDVYALGVIFYEMVTRDRPFAADDFVQLFMQVQQGEFRPPRELNPAITPGMEAAILGAMAVDPAQRIPDCETMLAVWRGKSTFNAAAQVPADRTGPWDMALVRRAAGLNAMESAPIRLTDPGPPPPAPREPPSVVSITESPPRVNRSVVLAVVLASGAAVLVVGGILAIAAFFGVTQLLPRKPEAVAVEVPAPVVAPEPVVAAPEPVVVAPEPVVPVPQPTRVAAPVAPVARMGRLKMTGDATNVWLVGGGRRWPPGDVPEGVYAVEAEFPSKGIQEVPLKATVVRDRETVVDCRSGFYTCTAR